MTEFRFGEASIPVATNVAARGLDFESAGQGINYDLPDSEQLFTHRIGRAAWAAPVRPSRSLRRRKR